MMSGLIFCPHFAIVILQTPSIRLHFLFPLRLSIIASFILPPSAFDFSEAFSFPSYASFSRRFHIHAITAPYFDTAFDIDTLIRSPLLLLLISFDADIIDADARFSSFLPFATIYARAAFCLRFHSHFVFAFGFRLRFRFIFSFCPAK